MGEVRGGWCLINSYGGMNRGRRQDLDCVILESICSRQAYDQWRIGSSRCVAIAKCRRSSMNVDLKMCLWQARPSIGFQAKIDGE